MVNKDRFYGELRYFWGISLSSIKSDEELRWEIRDFDIFIKMNQIKIHKIENHRIWIKIRKEINEQKLGRKSEREERENQS